MVYAAYRGEERGAPVMVYSFLTRASGGQVLIFLVTSDSKWHEALSEELGWILEKGAGFSWK